jgi:hypothetical protein
VARPSAWARIASRVCSPLELIFASTMGPK